MSVKQDRASPRTPADLERKYDLGSMGARFAEIMGVALDAQTHSEAALNAIEQTNGIVAELSEKVDEISITVKDLDEETVAALSVRVNEISLSVEKLDEDLTSTKSEISVELGNITASVGECAKKTDLDGYVTHEKLSSELEITKESITAAVEAEYVKTETLNGYVTNEKLASELAITSSSITASVKATYTKNDDFEAYQKTVTGEFVIGIINEESVAKISADRLDIYGKTLDIYVDATHINGSLTIGQLPPTVAETSDIPTKTSELTNDSDFATTGDIPTNVSDLYNDKGYQTESGVTTIVNGVVTTDFVNALGITAKYLDVDDLSAIGATIGGWSLESGRFYGGWYEEFSSDVDGSDMRWEYDVTFNPRNLRFEQSIYVDNTHDDTWSVTYNGSGITWDFGKVWIEDSRQYIMTIISNGMTFGVYPDMATGTLRIASN